MCWTEGRKLTTRNLLYPFARAFPAEISRQLLLQIPQVTQLSDPFEQLVQRAPSNIDSATVDFAEADRMERAAAPAPTRTTTKAIDTFSVTPTSRKRGNEAMFSKEEIMAMFGQLGLTANKAPRTAQRSSPGGRGPPCSGCRGNCTTRLQCPAQGKQCRSCGRLGHFAKVCKSSNGPTAGPRTGANATPTHQSVFRTGGSNGSMP